MLFSKLRVWLRRLFTTPAKVSTPQPVKPLTPPQAIEKPPATSADSHLRYELVRLIQRDIGQRETGGHNRGPLIDMINDELASRGDPYCISGLLVRGVRDLCKLYNLKNPVTMTASTQEFYDSTPAKYRYAKGMPGKKADICIQQSRSNPDSGHAYILEADQPSADSTQYTIEYNTDGSGGRDGDGVYRRERSQAGDLMKRYRGCVDVVAWILSANPNWQVPS